MTFNYASGNDFVSMQIGKVHSDEATCEVEAFEKKMKEMASQKSKVTNIRSGNARVGLQTDVVIGDIHIETKHWK